MYKCKFKFIKTVISHIKCEENATLNIIFVLMLQLPPTKVVSLLHLHLMWSRSEIRSHSLLYLVWIHFCFLIYCPHSKWEKFIFSNVLVQSCLYLQSIYTHQPALRESHSCFGLWPGSRAVSRCSSTSQECPHSGHSYSWLCPRTHLHLQSTKVNSQRFTPRADKSSAGYFTHLLSLPAHTSSCWCPESTVGYSCRSRSHQCWHSGR